MISWIDTRSLTRDGLQHPDKQRGDEQARAEATAKFQAVSAIHALLSDADARAQYDETGTIQAPEDDLSLSPSFQMWVDYFARVFPKVSQEDIARFEQQYRFSDEERRDVLDAYAKFEGDMRSLLDSIMLSTDDDEDRFIEIIEAAIKSKQAKRFPKFRELVKARAAKPAQTEAQKRKKQASRDKEAKEAESLMDAIRRNQERRANGDSSALSTKRYEWRGRHTICDTDGSFVCLHMTENVDSSRWWRALSPSSPTSPRKRGRSRSSASKTSRPSQRRKSFWQRSSASRSASEEVTQSKRHSTPEASGNRLPSCFEW